MGYKLETKNLYDGIDTYTLKVLYLLKDKTNFLVVDNIGKEEKYLWFLNMTGNLSKISSYKCYFKGKFREYLYFKYIKKFKYLHWYKKLKKDYSLVEIDANEFIKEMTSMFNVDENIVADIYNINYKRR